MSRGHRMPAEGGVFHLTHRCHNRSFLLKFARDRNAYRAKLRAHLEQHQLWLLDYCVTCNHVHLLVDAAERTDLSTWIQRVAGEFARAYNRRKGRANAFWGEQLPRYGCGRRPLSVALPLLHRAEHGTSRGGAPSTLRNIQGAGHQLPSSVPFDGKVLFSG